MPALDFPANPTNGQVYQNWIYSTSKGAWQAKPLTSAVATPSDTAPLNPDNGDLWYNTTDGSTYVYYVDGTSAQWVQTKSDSTFASTLGPRVDVLEAKSQNYIINGAFDIWQRGTSFSTSGYTADRWTGDFAAGAGTVSQQPFTPGAAPTAGYEGTFFLRRNVTTGAQFSSLIHRIEDVRTLAGQTVTLSFWAKGTNPTGNFLVNLLQTFGSGGSPDTSATALTSTSLVLTNLWTRYTYTFSLPSIAGKTIGANSYVWLSIYQAAANTSASTLDIWGVQLEAGAVATPFRRNSNSLQSELAACQRYFQPIFPASGDFNHPVIRESATQAVIAVRCLVQMRVPPALHNSSGAVAGGAAIGRLVMRDTSFGLGVATANFAGIYAPNEYQVHMPVTHSSIAGSFIYAEFDTQSGSTSALFLSAEL